MEHDSDVTFALKKHPCPACATTMFICESEFKNNLGLLYKSPWLHLPALPGEMSKIFFVRKYCKNKLDKLQSQNAI